MLTQLMVSPRIRRWLKLNRVLSLFILPLSHIHPQVCDVAAVAIVGMMHIVSQVRHSGQQLPAAALLPQHSTNGCLSGNYRSHILTATVIIATDVYELL